jgi:hypothetical protein
LAGPTGTEERNAQACRRSLQPLAISVDLPGATVDALQQPHVLEGLLVKANLALDEAVALATGADWFAVVFETDGQVPTFDQALVELRIVDHLAVGVCGQHGLKVDCGCHGEASFQSRFGRGLYDPRCDEPDAGMPPYAVQAFGRAKGLQRRMQARQAAIVWAKKGPWGFSKVKKPHG